MDIQNELDYTLDMSKVFDRVDGENIRTVITWDPFYNKAFTDLVKLMNIIIRINGQNILKIMTPLSGFMPGWHSGESADSVSC